LPERRGTFSQAELTADRVITRCTTRSPASSAQQKVLHHELTALAPDSSGTFAGFYRERQYLIGLGIPDEHLPDYRALGRTDLRP
jgi:hypothetical protein